MKTEYMKRGWFWAALVMLVLIVALLLLYSSYSKTQSLVEDYFVDGRNTIAVGGLAQIQGRVESEYGYLFVDCAERQEYDAFIDTDSRTMTASDLKRALELHAKCGNFFVEKSNITVQVLEGDVASLEETASLFSGSTKARNALVAAKYWRDIFELERERAIIFERLVNIQKAYWEIDLDKALGTISPKEREASVGALNIEANQKLARTNEIVEEVRELRKQEGVFWGESFGSEN